MDFRFFRLDQYLSIACTCSCPGGEATAGTQHVSQLGCLCTASRIRYLSRSLAALVPVGLRSVNLSFTCRCLGSLLPPRTALTMFVSREDGCIIAGCVGDEWKKKTIRLPELLSPREKHQSAQANQNHCVGAGRTATTRTWIDS